MLNLISYPSIKEGNVELRKGEIQVPGTLHKEKKKGTALINISSIVMFATLQTDKSDVSSSPFLFSATPFSLHGAKKKDRDIFLHENETPPLARRDTQHVSVQSKCK